MSGIVLKLKDKLIPYFNRESYAGMVLYFLIALVLGSAGGPNGMAPLGAAMVAAVYGTKRRGIFAATLWGSLAGALIMAHWQNECAIGGYFVIVSALRKVRIPLPKVARIVLITVIKLLLIPFAVDGSGQSVFFSVLDGGLTMCFALALSMADGAAIRLTKKQTLTNAHKAALCLLLGALSFALSDTTVFGTLRLGITFAGAIALLAAGTNGLAAIPFALAVGLGRAVYGDSLAFTGVLTVCLFAAAPFMNISRFAAAGSFVLTALVSAAFLGTAETFTIVEISASTLMFLFVPKRLYENLKFRSETQVDMTSLQTSVDTMRDRLYETANIIENLSYIYSKTEYEVSPYDDGAEFAAKQLSGVATVLRRISREETRPQARYDVQVGVAACPKHEGEDSGDSMAVKDVNGSILLLLSDGMGSGNAARLESETTLDLLSQLLYVGYELDEALQNLNRLLMRFGDSGDMYATLDAMMFNRNDASARFIKFGAPPSYVIRNGKVHTLYSETLPIGIVSQASPFIHQVGLKRGDTVVLMSDGTADALGSGLIATLLERVCAENTAEDAANAVLDAAMQNGIYDDMSVMVARVS